MNVRAKHRETGQTIIGKLTTAQDAFTLGRYKNFGLTAQDLVVKCKMDGRNGVSFVYELNKLCDMKKRRVRKEQQR